MGKWLPLTISNMLLTVIFDRSDIAKFFQPSVDCIVKAVLDQREASEHEVNVRFILSAVARIDY